MSETPENAPILIACAVHAEARAVARGVGVELNDRVRFWEPIDLSTSAHLMVTGVGKANAAGATARALALGTYSAVWSVGVAGALPGVGGGVEIGGVVRAGASIFADEGVRTPEGFATIDEAGFPTTDGLDGALLDGHGATAPLPTSVRERAAVGTIATVSTGSGTDALARELADRTGAIAEAMEGAAVGLACARAGVPFAEIRAISNTTGDRERQSWDLRAALEAISELFSGDGTAR